MRTQDVDFAQEHGISISIDDATPDLFEVLRKIDPTFRAVPHISERTRSSAFENRDRFKVEFLTTNRGSDAVAGHLTNLPTLPGVGAVPLRYLDFLVRDPVRSVVLYDAGISVRVPAPQRYAIHKVIVSTQRPPHAALKADKDLDQAAALILGHALTRRGAAIAEAWMEAWDRGETWREKLAMGAIRLDPEALATLRTQVLRDSTEHGFKIEAEPTASLTSAIKP